MTATEKKIKTKVVKNCIFMYTANISVVKSTSCALCVLLSSTIDKVLTTNGSILQSVVFLQK